MPYSQLRPLSRFQRKAAAFGPSIIVLILGLIISLTVYNSRANRHQNILISGILQTTTRLQTQLIDAETAQRGYLLTGDSSYLPNYYASLDSLRKAFDSLNIILRGTRDREHARQTLDTLIPAKLSNLEHELGLRRTGLWESSQPFTMDDQGRELTTRIRSTVTTIRRSEQRLISERQLREDRWERRTLLVVALGTGLTVTFAILANIFLTRFADAQAHAAGISQRRSQLATELAIAQTMARESAEAANIAKTHFLTAMSHELRTPLNAINGYTELLSMGIAGDVTARQKDFLDRIARSGRYLLALINDVLNFAKLEEGRVAFRIEETPLDPVLRSVEQMTALQFTKNEIEYSYEPEDPALTVLADPERVRQIVLNLVINAVKNTSKGGSISLSTRVEGGHAVIDVTDTGCGISNNKLATIFDPFIQIDRQLTTQGSQQGVGLGLSISRDLARQMGGELSVESELGVGSTFTLTLPIPPAKSADKVESVTTDKTVENSAS